MQLLQHVLSECMQGAGPYVGVGGLVAGQGQVPALLKFMVS